MSKFTDEQIRKILQMRREGYSTLAIRERFGGSVNKVNDIFRKHGIIKGTK